MAFSTQRGRPRNPAPAIDLGTPELRLKHALRLTAEPIDIFLEKNILTHRQHWCGLHLRWLYTLRYGAPNLTTRYADPDTPSTPPETTPEWRSAREQEYHEAIQALKAGRRYEPVTRLAIFNEIPAFLRQALQARAWENAPLAQMLHAQHRALQEGFIILENLWRTPPNDA